METPKEPNPKPRGSKHQVGQCDYKLAYMSLWWKRMERDEIKEKIDRSLGKRMKAFLMDGKMNVSEKIYEKEKSGITAHRQVRKVNSTGPSAVLTVLTVLNVWNNVVLQIIIELLIQEQHQTSKNVSL